MAEVLNRSGGPQFVVNKKYACVLQHQMRQARIGSVSATNRVLIGYCILAVTTPTHIVACAGLVAHPGAVTVVIEIPLRAAETLVPILSRHVESPSDVAVLVAELL